ncbi:flagellar hook-basal body complex protein FliE [Planctomicrobium piriforme]|uniref:Flagellar hook-basal body complex protein FliE n=1 Tax=Planctomicrobium piriforme TaxID=1576369 RepID=A0A1I3GRA9_9PLAN|nr:flagellar hook-basal body complex protein FliE [Planctomicrobium piriforme]SFI25953.1 flagellar hook-basal body complex protein FliE [Planctomicrobium piriforme]
MQIGSVTTGMPSIAAPQLETARSTASPREGTPFASMVSQFLQEVDQPQQKVAQGVSDLVAGKTDNVHEIAINVAQADLAFRMAMEVRDKLINAFQEVMRMQV